MSSFPPNFIPIVDAFTEAVEKLAPAPTAEPDPTDLGEEEFDREFGEFAQQRDEAKRKVERLFRDALAEGALDAWVQCGAEMQILSDRESWHPEAFGLPGFEPRTHHLTNPGPNDDREVFIERRTLKAWIAGLTATGNRPGRPPIHDWPAIEKKAKDLMDYHSDFSEDDPEWNKQACLERALLKFCSETFGREPTPSALRDENRIPKWLSTWRSENRREDF
jgi:hypothetical protein